MRNPLIAAAAAALLIAAPAAAQDLAANAVALRDKALADTTAWDFLESITTEVGGRPTGSPEAARARDWGVAYLTGLGFKNVHVESYEAEAWLRGPEAAAITAPFPQKLSILGLGRSAPTPKKGIEAEIVLFGSFAELTAQPPGSLAGKIAVISQPMPRTQDGAGYGFVNANRTRGPAEASKRGAVAFLTRSLSTDDTRLPHTGSTVWGTATPIPAAALSVPDAQLIERMAARGKPVRIRLSMASTSIPKAPAWNVVGEMPGTSAPDEVLVVGGHLDSWDPGTGAVDDGAGMAITTAAAKLAAAGGVRRTIRVVLWGAEEMGGAGEAYAAAHKEEVGKIVLAGESDSGDGPVWRARLPKGSAGHPAMKAFLAAIAPLQVVLDPQPATGGGADIEGLTALGTPSVVLSPDASRYFDLHHSADDTLDKIRPQALSQSVAVWTAFLHVVANSDIDFRKLANPEAK